MIKTTGWYFASFIVGILIVVFFFLFLFELSLFGVGASTYPAFFTFMLMYFLLGLALSGVFPGESISHAFFLALPMWLFLFPFNFSDYVPKEVLPRWFAALSPFSACLGALVRRRILQKNL